MKEFSKSGLSYQESWKYWYDMILNWIFIFCQHGPISSQGILLHTGDAICYKKFTRKLSTKKKKPRECMVFIFRETVIICEKVTDDKPYSPQLFNYWLSFQVPINLFVFITYSRVQNRRRAGNNHRAWKICQKENT